MKKEIILFKLKELNKKVLTISEVYDNFFSDSMNELAFFKAIERLTKEGELVKISKGIYGFSSKTKYGYLKPSEKEILDEYVGIKKGIQVGYKLYNSLNVSTQISKNTKIYSNVIKNDIKKIDNIEIKKVNLDFNSLEVNTIKYLEIINNYNNIQDINKKQFIVAMEEFSKIYNDKTTNKVIDALKYKKRTIAFIKEVLDYYNVKNDLSKYLSCYSNYDIPKMRDIYELA